MAVDPLGDGVPDLGDEGIDEVDPNDGFINQVEVSQAWTTMRANLAVQMFADYWLTDFNGYLFCCYYPIVDFTIDGKPEVQRGIRGRKRGGSNTRRVWTFAEECELIHGLKDLVVKGNKCDNGFRTGYLLILENWLTAKFPGTDLKGEPHINSKIHVWKRQYVCLKSMLGIYGVELNSITYHVDALPEVWDAQIRVDAFTKSLRNKAFSFYAQWGEIFGNDRATGQDSQLYTDAVDEVMTSSVKQTRTTMDVDEDGESTHAPEEYTTEKTSFSVDGNSSATRDIDKGKK
ncbi:hypothetical protein ACS0TY_005670 [Phlomoides rotata]